MGNTVVEREAEEQIKFGNYLVTFEDNMRKACKQFRSHLADASDNMKDESGQQAIKILEELAQDIESGLNGVSDFGEKQKKLGGYVKEAEDFKFRI